MKSLLALIDGVTKTAFIFAVFTVMFWLLVILVSSISGTQPGPESMGWGAIYIALIPFMVIAAVFVSRRKMSFKSKTIGGLFRWSRIMIGVVILPFFMMMALVFLVFPLMIMVANGSALLVKNAMWCNLNVWDKYGEFKRDCVGRVAVKTRDPGQCIKYNGSRDMGYCLAKVSMISGVEICDKYQGQLDRYGYRGCVLTVAEGKRQPELCSKITIDADYKLCIDRVTDLRRIDENATRNRIY